MRCKRLARFGHVMQRKEKHVAKRMINIDVEGWRSMEEGQRRDGWISWKKICVWKMRTARWQLIRLNGSRHTLHTVGNGQRRRANPFRLFIRCRRRTSTTGQRQRRNGSASYCIQRLPATPFMPSVHQSGQRFSANTALSGSPFQHLSPLGPQSPSANLFSSLKMFHCDCD